MRRAALADTPGPPLQLRCTFARMLAAHRLLTLVAVVAIAATGCGGDGGGPASATTSPTTAAGPDAPAEVTSERRESAPDAAAFETVPSLHPSVDDWDEGTVEVVTGDGTVHHVAVRLATTPDQRSHGLMEVPDLPDGAGMWFVYGQDRTGGFWMKNTLVPLDIAYVGEDERIVSVAHAVPCESDPCPVYAPDATYHHVLEVPGGYLERIGAGVGDVARLLEP